MGRRKVGKDDPAGGTAAALGGVASTPRCAVVYATDGDPGDQQRMVWSIRSLLRHAPRGYDIVVMARDPVPGVQASVSRDLGDIGFSCVSDMDDVLGSVGISDVGWNRAWPFVVLYRLGIPIHPAMSGYDRVLYLDTDTLVLSDRVVDFMHADLSGFEVGGVPDTAQEANNRISRVLRHDLRAEYADKIVDAVGESVLTRSYVNAGVLLFNLGEFRRDIGWFEERLRMFWESECRGGFGFLDQDFVNAMTRVRSDFSLVFNWFNACDRESGACVIRHFCARRYADMARKAAEEGLL